MLRGSKMRLDDIYVNDFSRQRSIDITQIDDHLFPIIGQLPKRATRGCSRLVISILLKRDIRPDLEAGFSADGATDRCPFFTPLVWNAIVNLDDWETERRNIETLLDYPVDCNKIGLCGFNLYHLYIARSIVSNDTTRLEWWTRHPMIDLDAPLLHMRNRTIVHPLRLIPVGSRAYHILVSRGITCDRSVVDAVDPSDPLFRERRLIQFDGIDENDTETIRKERLKRYGDACLTMTPQMNPLVEISPSQVLYLDSPFIAFHGAYMDIITKTHIFPFTAKPLQKPVIRAWMDTIRQSGRFRREENPMCELEDIRSSPIILNHDSPPKHDPVHLLHAWLVQSFPYTRIMLIEKAGAPIFEYLCREMSKGEYIFPSFPLQIPPDAGVDWRDRFFWGAYLALEEDGYLLSDRLEILLTRIDIFYRLEKDQSTPFHTRVSYRTFGDCDHRFIDLYREEHGLSEFEVYASLRALSLFLSSRISMV